jgi:hypothetical protein
MFSQIFVAFTSTGTSSEYYSKQYQTEFISERWTFIGRKPRPLGY